jgi:hypothetical protein
MQVEARGVAAYGGTLQAELEPGELVSHYRIISPLGAGGKGQVFLAHDMTKRLTDFSTDSIFYFAWSRDGKQLALARGTVTHDVVLISNFQDQ